MISLARRIETCYRPLYSYFVAKQAQIWVRDGKREAPLSCGRFVLALFDVPLAHSLRRSFHPVQAVEQ